MIRFEANTVSFVANHDLLDDMVAEGIYTYDDWFLNNGECTASEELRVEAIWNIQKGVDKDQETCEQHGGYHVGFIMGTGENPYKTMKFANLYLKL